MAIRNNVRNRLESHTDFVRNKVDRALPPVQDDTWSRYEQMAAVPVWKIVALSCDLDPDALLVARTTRTVTSGRPGSGAILRKVLKLAIPVDNYDDLRLRWIVTVNCLVHGKGIAPQRKNSRPPFATVRVADFVRFADTKGWALPEKLRRICGPTEQPSTDSDENERKREEWEIPGTLAYMARMIGLAYFKECKKNKRPANVKSVADHVAAELKRQGRKGPRGYWSAETVKRQALSGITGRKPNGR